MSGKRDRIVELENCIKEIEKEMEDDTECTERHIALIREQARVMEEQLKVRNINRQVNIERLKGMME